MNNDNDRAADTQRRSFLRVAGMAAGMMGGMSVLSACGGGGDTPAAGPTPTPTPSPTPAPSPGPTYSATDPDRLNFLLQVNYLFAGYMARGVLGQSLPAAITGGAGTSGALTGGVQVAFADALEGAMLREVAYEAQAQITRLRAVLGAAATAQPAITIAGGASGPFQAIASTTAFPAASPFDPYASAETFLVGALALTSLRASVFTETIRLVSDRTNVGTVAGLAAVSAQHDAMVRQMLWIRARSQEALFNRLDQLSDARDGFDGNSDLDQGVGGSNNANFTVADDQAVWLRRSPEQALNILYATRSAAASGGFFPAGVNGLVRFSGANTP